MPCLLTRDSAQTTRNRDLQRLSSPLTDSNRRPPPYHGGALPTELRGQEHGILAAVGRAFGSGSPSWLINTFGRCFAWRSSAIAGLASPTWCASSPTRA